MKPDIQNKLKLINNELETEMNNITEVSNHLTKIEC